MHNNEHVRKSSHVRRSRIFISVSAMFVSLLISGAASAFDCVDGRDTMTGLACVSEHTSPVVPPISSSAVAYFELRGPKGIAAMVLVDGTTVAFDFAAGKVAHTAIGQAAEVKSVGELDSRSQQQFWQLAGIVAGNPHFSFEMRNGSPPNVPGHSHLLLASEFGLPGIGSKSGDDDEDGDEKSPCNADACLDALNVTTSLPSFGGIGFLRIIGGGGVAPPLPMPIEIACDEGVDPATCRYIIATNRASWDRWRGGRCNDAAANLAPGVAAGAATWGTCVTPVVVSVVPCAGSAITYALLGVLAADAGRACRLPYRGPGTWP